MHLQEEPSRLAAIQHSTDDGACQWFGDIAGSLCNKDAGFNDDDAPAGTAQAVLSGLARGGSIGCEELDSTVLHIKSPNVSDRNGRGIPLCRLERMGLGRCKTHFWTSSQKPALEVAPLSRSSAKWSIGTTGVKTTAELLEQEDASASATGTTRAGCDLAVTDAGSSSRRPGTAPRLSRGMEPTAPGTVARCPEARWHGAQRSGC